MTSGLTPDHGLSLTPENEQFVQQQLDMGIYAARKEVINAGLDVLRRRQSLKDRLARSAHQLETGEYTDFDQAGFSICQNLSDVSWAARDANTVAYEFRNKINVTDLGLRLTDVERLNLKPERCRSGAVGVARSALPGSAIGSSHSSRNSWLRAD